MYQRIVPTNDLPWDALDVPGVSLKVLQKSEDTGAMSVITRMEAGATIPAHSHSKADETVYVLEGDFVEDGVRYGQGHGFFRESANRTWSPSERKWLFRVDAFFGGTRFHSSGRPVSLAGDTCAGIGQCFLQESAVSCPEVVEEFLRNVALSSP